MQTSNLVFRLTARGTIQKNAKLGQWDYLHISGNGLETLNLVCGLIIRCSNQKCKSRLEAAWHMTSDLLL